LEIAALTRPKVQSTFALWGGPNLDLKSGDFQNAYQPHWFKFTLTSADKEAFNDPAILSIKDDEVALHIFDWYENYAKTNPNISVNTAKYFSDKVDALKEYL
jgi:hypothetical protein